MPTKTLNPDEFGLKLYNRFPPSYRLVDVDNQYALKRYLQATADGGFKYVIEEQNGILDLVDPQKSPLEVVYLLYEQYGLPLFHGIPEEFLRAFLPELGVAWSKKGSLDAIEYIVSSLSGIKTTTEITYDEFGNPTVTVRLEMDFSASEYFPNTEQFNRILENFIPFYCDALLVYSYVYTEEGNIHGTDDTLDRLFMTEPEEGRIPYGIHYWYKPLTDNPGVRTNDNFILNNVVGFGIHNDPALNSNKMLNKDFILNAPDIIDEKCDVDSFRDKIIVSYEESGNVSKEDGEHFDKVNVTIDDSGTLHGEETKYLDELKEVLTETGTVKLKEEEALTYKLTETVKEAGTLTDTFEVTGEGVGLLNNAYVGLNHNFILSSGAYMNGVDSSPFVMSLNSQGVLLNYNFILNGRAMMEKYLDEVKFSMVRDNANIRAQELVLTDKTKTAYTEEVCVKCSDTETDKVKCKVAEELADVVNERVACLNDSLCMLNGSFVLTPATAWDLITTRGTLNGMFVLNKGHFTGNAEVVTLLAPVT